MGYMGTKNSFSAEVSGYRKGLVLCSMFDDRITRKLCTVRKQELRTVYAGSCDQCKRGRNLDGRTFARNRRKKAGVDQAGNDIHGGRDREGTDISGLI